MNKEQAVDFMIQEVEKIEQEIIVERYSTDKALKKDAVSKICKKLQEVSSNENQKNSL